MTAHGEDGKIVTSSVFTSQNCLCMVSLCYYSESLSIHTTQAASTWYRPISIVGISLVRVKACVIVSVQRIMDGSIPGSLWVCVFHACSVFPLGAPCHRQPGRADNSQTTPPGSKTTLGSLAHLLLMDADSRKASKRLWSIPAWNQPWMQPRLIGCGVGVGWVWGGCGVGVGWVWGGCGGPSNAAP